jgi:cell division protein FtsI/penicillin-binding protein 2
VEPDFEQHQNNQTLVDALKVSCNYYFFRVADMIGIDSLVEWGDKFGLMTKTNIELTGRLPDR